MKHLSCYCTKPILWELKSFRLETISFVSKNLSTTVGVGHASEKALYYTKHFFFCFFFSLIVVVCLFSVFPLTQSMSLKKIIKNNKTCYVFCIKWNSEKIQAPDEI